MNLSAKALLSIYELTALLAIAILPALMTVYVIMISLMRQKLLRTKQDLCELKSLKTDAGVKFQAKLKSVESEGSPRNILSKLTEEWETYEKDLANKADRFNTREARLSLKGFLLLPAGLLLGCTATVLVAIAAVHVPSPCFWFSLVPYAGGAVLLFLALRRIVWTMKETNQLAREPLSKEEGTSERLLVAKLDEMLGLKEPKFSVRLEVENKLADRLTIKKAIEEECILSVVNSSPYAMKETCVEMALPEGFGCEASAPAQTVLRPAIAPCHPRGISTTFELHTLNSGAGVRLRFKVTGNTVGEFKMHLWVLSTTHKRYHRTLKVHVEEQ